MKHLFRKTNNTASQEIPLLVRKFVTGVATLIRKGRMPYTPVLLLCYAFAMFFTSCSVTKNLPEGEQLYTGIKSIEFGEKKKSNNDSTGVGHCRNGRDHRQTIHLIRQQFRSGRYRRHRHIVRSQEKRIARSRESTQGSRQKITRNR